MSICSAHRERRSDCRLCNADARDLIPNYDELKKEAEKAGLVICHECEFEYYLTVKSCPLCEADYKPS
jgi:hypothetical protein